MKHNQTNPKQLKALISGGTAGLGLELVRQLAAAGAAVATFARHQEGIDRLRRELPGVVAFRADITEKEDIHRIAGQAFAALGNVNLLVHNASSLGPVPLRGLLDTDCERFEEALQANLLGPFRLTKAILPGMLTGGGGLVVHLSSDAAVQAYPGWGAYSAAKAASDHLARIWGEELKREGVQFVAVDPGDMRTNFHFTAVPGADPASLRDPAEAARALLERISSGGFEESRVRL